MNPPVPTVPYARAADSSASGSYRWWVVFMLWFICFFNYADRQAISAVFPKLADEFHFSPFQLGLIGSAFMWVYAFGAPFAGFIADRFRRKNLILGGCFFWSLVTVTTSWCATLHQFIIVRALEGLGETFYFPASMSLISDYHDGSTRSRALSFHQSSVYAGTILGSWIAALLAERGGWRDGFYLFGGCGVLLVVVLSVALREPKRGSATDFQETPDGELLTPSPRTRGEGGGEGRAVGNLSSGKNPLPNPLPGYREREDVTAPWISILKPSAILLMLAFLCANFVATIFLTWTPTFLVEKFGFKLAAAGLSGSLFIHLASAFGAPLGGILADALRVNFPGGRMIIQAAGLIIGCVFLFLVGSTKSQSTLLISMTVFGFGKGLYDSNIFASLYDVVEPRARATAAGVMNTVGWGGGALGPLAVGWFTQHGKYATKTENMSHAIAATSAIYVVGAALLLIVAFVSIHRDQIELSD